MLLIAASVAAAGQDEACSLVELASVGISGEYMQRKAPEAGELCVLEEHQSDALALMLSVDVEVFEPTVSTGGEAQQLITVMRHSHCLLDKE